MSYREKLIEALKNAPDEYGVIKMSTQIRDIIVEELEKDSKDSKWISVKERLPEQKWIDCFVATKIPANGARGINVAWVNDDYGVWKSNDEWICDGREIVTHWMPLPEPPKEDQ